MTLLHIFRSRQFNEWLAINREAKRRLKDFKRYLLILRRKLECVQYVSLRLYDFEKGVYEDMKNTYVRFPGTHRSRSLVHIPEKNYAKLNRRFFKLLKKRLNSLRPLIERDILLKSRDQHGLLFLHQSLLAHMIEDQAMTDKVREEVAELTDIEKEGKQLTLLLQQQNEAYHILERVFLDFYRSTKVHSADELRNEVKGFREKLAEFADLLVREAKIVTGTDFPDDPAMWQVNLSQKVAQYEQFKDLHDIIITSDKEIDIDDSSNETLYHIYDGRRVKRRFPLRAVDSPNGFYVCTSKGEYAELIKKSHTGGVSDALNWSAAISIPKVIFHKLFIPDENEGLEQRGTVDAYEHASYLPVSRYPLFNFYLERGWVVEVKDQKIKKAA